MDRIGCGYITLAELDTTQRNFPAILATFDPLCHQTVIWCVGTATPDGLGCGGVGGGGEAKSNRYGHWSHRLVGVVIWTETVVVSVCDRN